MTSSCAALRFVSTLALLLLVGTASILSAEEIHMSLGDAITRSLDHSFGIKSAAHDSAAAALRFGRAQALRFPVLSLDAKSYWVNDLQTVKLGPRPMELGSKENYQLEVKLSLPLFTGGRLSRTIGIEKENSAAESFRLQAERMALAYQTRVGYLHLMLADASVRTARASLERLAIIDRDLHNLFQSGLADSVDILDAILALEKGRQVVEQQETIYRNASLALATLIGLDAAGGLVPNEAVEPPSSPDVSDSAAITRYEISQIDRRIRAAELGAGLSQAEYYPSVSGFGGYSVGKPNRDMFEKSWNDYFSAGVVLTWAFNTGGTTGKAVAAARQTALSARMARAELLEALRLQSQTARNNLEQAFRTVQVIANERDIARRQYRLAGDQQKAGQLSVNRLLELETSLTTTEQQYQAALIQYYLADGDYLYAVGSPKIFGGLR